jgi:red chlorophyll catabolite reductase
MVDLVSTVENRLDSHLLPCKLPPDVQYYENPISTAHASVNIRSGAPSSQIDFILGSWLHCELPNGATLNISSLSGFLNSSTDAPNLSIEFIQSSPTSYIIIIDLPPRKDVVLHEQYLKTFYEETQLDKHRENLYNLAEVQPYFSSSLFIRSVVSPTAILLRLESPNTEGILRDHVGPVAREVLNVWLDLCACGEREVGEDEKEGLCVRDRIIRRKTYEIDLATNLPRLFGEKTASRVLDELQKVFCA